MFAFRDPSKGLGDETSSRLMTAPNNPSQSEVEQYLREIVFKAQIAASRSRDHYRIGEYLDRVRDIRRQSASSTREVQPNGSDIKATATDDLELSPGLARTTSDEAFDSDDLRNDQIPTESPMQWERPESHGVSIDPDSDERSRSETSISNSGSLNTSIEEVPSALANSATDDDDGASDVTEFTDLSLIEAFEASPTLSNAVLLSALLSIKDEVVLRVNNRLRLLLADGLRQRPSNETGTGQVASQSMRGTVSDGINGGQSSDNWKRSIDSDAEGNDTGNGGDENKRRRNGDIAIKVVSEKLMGKFACPFYKRYPESGNLQKSCHGPGWQSVHRVK
jgi:hypothetical protein